ncbi:hypothetical protein NLG97_g5044 [Lecanicillium saksenae]|uniref:Uncharacterized protein n=1 Tax=Lecanicillium saksenae TaxID=468837 RepID=A0ACC1QUR8_9HYPO|nr:hypothetical protein NLG97_g5044 [Lecanicillium saksenae]
MSLPSSGDVSPTTITSPIATWRRSSLPISESPSMGLHRTSKIRRRAVAGFLVCLVLFLWVTSSSYRARRSQGIMSWRTAIQQAAAKHTGMAAAAAGSSSSSDGKQPKLIKLSMMYGESNEHYERALETQKKHSERWGHELRVLRENISAGFWNRPTYMLSTIITELSKPHDERVEWVM